MENAAFWRQSSCPEMDEEILDRWCLIRRLAKLPFVFNVRIRAPFRALLETASDFYSPENLVRRALRQNPPAPPVQPPESEKVR